MKNHEWSVSFFLICYTLFVHFLHQHFKNGLVVVTVVSTVKGIKLRWSMRIHNKGTLLFQGALLINLINWNRNLTNLSKKAKYNYIYLCFLLQSVKKKLLLTFDNFKEAIQKPFICLHWNKYYAKMQTSQNAPCVIIFCILDLSRKEGIYLHYECDDEVSQKTTFDECKGYWGLNTIYIYERKSWFLLFWHLKII